MWDYLILVCFASANPLITVRFQDLYRRNTEEKPDLGPWHLKMWSLEWRSQVCKGKIIPQSGGWEVSGEALEVGSSEGRVADKRGTPCAGGECGWVREGSKKEGAFKTGPEGMEEFLFPIRGGVGMYLKQR